MYVLLTQASACIWRNSAWRSKVSFQESVLLLPYMGPWDGTPVIRLGGRCLLGGPHLTAPCSSCFSVFRIYKWNHTVDSCLYLTFSLGIMCLRSHTLLQVVFKNCGKIYIKPVILLLLKFFVAFTYLLWLCRSGDECARAQECDVRAQLAAVSSPSAMWAPGSSSSGSGAVTFPCWAVSPAPR